MGRIDLRSVWQCSRKHVLFFCLVLLLNSGLCSFFHTILYFTHGSSSRACLLKQTSRVYFFLQLLSTTRCSQLPKLLTLLREFSLSFELIMGEREGGSQSSSRKLEKDFAYDARKKRWRSMIRTEDSVCGSLKLCCFSICYSPVLWHAFFFVRYRDLSSCTLPLV